MTICGGCVSCFAQRQGQEKHCLTLELRGIGGLGLRSRPRDVVRARWERLRLREWAGLRVRDGLRRCGLAEGRGEIERRGEREGEREALE
jgi:hypothetical protein